MLEWNRPVICSWGGNRGGVGRLGRGCQWCSTTMWKQGWGVPYHLVIFCYHSHCLWQTQLKKITSGTSLGSELSWILNFRRQDIHWVLCFLWEDLMVKYKCSWKYIVIELVHHHRSIFNQIFNHIGTYTMCQFKMATSPVYLASLIWSLNRIWNIGRDLFHKRNLLRVQDETCFV